MWHPVSQLSEIPDGSGREFVAGDRIVAVFRSGDQLWATDGICPHAGGPLGEGKLEGTVVTCPWHGWQLDVSTGRHCLTPQIRVQCFDVQVVEGEVQVDLP
ncbi:Rieske (2Fe-2S) protein [Planctomicrobium sp. SH527]|uniref:Rieske (2Fe-2S) protein n=1 Tax=Planctomicrobium sp. SH527 TaxID=3448123 RepID=UPI003F5BA74C